MLHSPDPALREAFDLRFALPSACADQIAAGEADIGILPGIEVARQKLDYFRATGIACNGPVRSILLVSKVPFARVRTLAVDSGSRSSVMLSRVLLAEKYGAEPRVFAHPPDLVPMLEKADAALLIGDPALRLDLATLPFAWLDLGGEWVDMTGLPMVFAVWGGRKEVMRPEYEDLFVGSCRWGLTHIDEIARAEAPIRQVSEETVRTYLTRHIMFELDDRAHQGLNLYLEHALRLDRTAVPGGVSV